MRRLTLFLIVAVIAFAAAGFWERVVEIESRFYTHQEAGAIAVSRDGNATATKRPLDASSIVDERVALFNQLLSVLKERPYDVKRERNPFFDPSEAKRERSRLLARIGVNSEYGYTAAVTRDKIALKSLETKERIYRFFVHLADAWTTMDES